MHYSFLGHHHGSRDVPLQQQLGDGAVARLESGIGGPVFRIAHPECWLERKDHPATSSTKSSRIVAQIERNCPVRHPGRFI